MDHLADVAAVPGVDPLRALAGQNLRVPPAQGASDDVGGLDGGDLTQEGAGIIGEELVDQAASSALELRLGQRPQRDVLSAPRQVSSWR
jgi:hypothetical protein